MRAVETAMPSRAAARLAAIATGNLHRDVGSGGCQSEPPPEPLLARIAFLRRIGHDQKGEGPRVPPGVEADMLGAERRDGDAQRRRSR